MHFVTMLHDKLGNICSGMWMSTWSYSGASPLSNVGH